MNRMNMKKTTLLWLGIAILGLVLYMLPVLQHKRTKESFSTGSSAADAMATTLNQTLEEQRKLTEQNALTAQTQANRHLFEQFQTSIQSNTVDPLTGIAVTSETQKILTPQTPQTLMNPILQVLPDYNEIMENYKKNPTQYNESMVQRLLAVTKELNDNYKKNPTFTFSQRMQNQAKQQLPELDKLIQQLETIRQNKSWESANRNFIDRANSGDLLFGYTQLLNEYKKAANVVPTGINPGATPGTTSNTLPAGVLPLTESDRITVEILKQTLDEIQQLSQKYKSHSFKQAVKASVLLKKIPEMELKLSQVQKDGWDLSESGKSFREIITSGALQKDYDAILEELKSTDANSAVQDMKDLWKNQTGKELPQEFESLKSSPGSCRITQQYVTSPSELQGCVSRQTKKITPVPKYKCPDMRDYIHKSKIPNMTDYIRKDSIPCWACKL